MFLPYSTDAPIYYFPWMTIVLIVANGTTFAITMMGLQSDGWLLTYGDGLHPVQWVAYNFLHFGPFHLIGNMFFLWAFGIVVEGKLGWWKFLALYLSIGILGGILIQTAMLGHVPRDHLSRQTVPPFEPNFPAFGGSVFAQDFGIEDAMDDTDNDDPLPPGMNGNPLNQAGVIDPDLDPINDDFPEDPADTVTTLPDSRDGAGGASLIIYGLMAIVLVWAPRNEIHCVWIGLRAGTFEFEYLYFCGFYIATEILSAVFSIRGFEVSSEIGHATGALIGFGFGTLLVKQNWVDCENWDLYSVMAGKHDAAMRVGGWQDDELVRSSRRKDVIVAFDDQAFDDPNSPRGKSKRKKPAKLKPKLVELESFDDPFEDPHEQPLQDRSQKDQTRKDQPMKEQGRTASPLPVPKIPLPPSPPPIPPSRKKAHAVTSATITARIQAHEYSLAFEEFLELRQSDPGYQLVEDDLRRLSNGLFKSKATNEAALVLKEYIDRFPEQADSQRVKLSVLYVKYLRRPTAALKLLVKVNKHDLPADYRPVYRQAVVEAQQMIAEGVTDAE